MHSETSSQAHELAGSCRNNFTQTFNHQPDTTAIAPGRVNLIGEHVDYNGGFVLPMAIDRHVAICARKIEGKTCKVRAGEAFKPAEITLDAVEKADPFWSNYLRGVVAGFQAKGIQVPAFEAFVSADLPQGGGLSSSAALEVATATMLEALSGQSIDPKEKALLCQTAEHEFAGVPCGIMDQFAVTLAEANNLLLLDCRSQEIEQVPFRSDQLTVVIANTKVSHSLADGEYAKRREQCEEAEKALGVESLRDANWMQLEMSKEKMSEVVFRRARHVITEIERTTNCANRLRAGEWTAVASLLFSSHDSLRDDYEVSCDELDTMVDIARSPDFDGLVYGSRMTGGGFGGSTVSLVHPEMVDRFMNELGEQYLGKTGIEPAIFATEAVQGTRLVP